MSKLSESKLVQAMQTPEVRRTTRRMTLRTVLVMALVLALLCGAALAAVSWGVQDLISYQDEEGNLQVNEELAGYIQPVGQTFEGDLLKADVIDAIYDGHAVTLAWQMQNKSDGEIYLLTQDTKANGDWLAQGSSSQLGELFMQPGETISSGLSMRTAQDDGADTTVVTATFYALKPHGEVVKIDAMDGNGSEEDHERYMQNIDDLVADGKIVLAPDGIIELGRNVDYSENPTMVQLLEASGLFTLVDTVEMSVTLQKNAEERSAVSEGTLPEKDNGGYTLRVVKAELSPNAATFIVERVFADKAAADAYSEYFAGKNAPFWSFAFLDETGDIWWNHNGGGGSVTEEPLEMDDGSWIWAYEATMTGIVRVPKTITIVPQRDNPQTGEYSVAYPEEAITVSFE